MSLLLDLGNTRLKIARMIDGRVGEMAAFTHGASDFADALRAWLANHRDTRTAWLAAVAPDAVIDAVQGLLRSDDRHVQRVVTQAECAGLRVAYADHTRLGVDRWLALLAVHAAGESPALIASVGSALTVDALAAQGRHLGGVIAPPPEAMRAALVARAPRLDVAAGQIARFATRTEDAIASGCLLSATSLIERSLLELARQSELTPQLILSGGGAAELRPWLPPHTLRPHLVLEGLACWATQQAE
jgi:type III pantothenate kinase